MQHFLAADLEDRLRRRVQQRLDGPTRCEVWGKRRKLQLDRHLQCVLQPPQVAGGRCLPHQRGNGRGSVRTQVGGQNPHARRRCRGSRGEPARRRAMRYDTAGDRVVRGQPDDVVPCGNDVAVGACAIPRKDAAAGLRPDLVQHAADIDAEAVPHVQRQTLGSRGNLHGDGDWQSGRYELCLRQERSRARGPCNGGHCRLGGVLVDRVPGRVADRDRRTEESEAIEELADLVGVLPRHAAVLGRAAEPAREIADPQPPTQPWLSSMKPMPSRLALRCGSLTGSRVQVRATIAVFRMAPCTKFSKETKPTSAVEELDLPAPFAEGKAGFLPGEAVGPGDDRHPTSRARPA